ncbi:DUF3152 domain-containing protein [Streptomyces sp. NPDC048187]|uniref:DUF3152 domain-containing protein n=1 Tax=Streptomyces sp. NPDC048187 TaxID=3365509 RepID=UPI003722CA4C
MGRHSRRGPAPKADAADTAAARDNRPGRPDPRRAAESSQGPAGPSEPHATHGPHGPHGSRQQQNGPTGPTGPRASNRPDRPQRAPDVARGAAPGAVQGGRQGYATPGPGQGRGAGARLPDGTPAHGFPRMADGTPARGVPRVSDGTPAHGLPRMADGTPAHGVPRYPDGTPAHGVPEVRGGHPELREPGGGWGEPSGRPGAGAGPAAGPRNGAPTSFSPGSPAGAPAPSVPFPRQRRGSQGGPRQDYLDAFEADDVFAVRPPRRGSDAGRPADPYASVTDWSAADGAAAGDGGGRGGAVDADDRAPTGEPAPAKGAKGRTFTGIAAAAVTTVLAVVVAGQVADGADGSGLRAPTATDQARDAHSASRDDVRPSAASEAAAPLTYEQKMGKTYPLKATLKGSGKFDAVPGVAKGPGKGQKYTYRVDVEQGLGLDGELFAEAVQKTLNDDRSWAHDGARSFERIHSGQPDFVITLASPGTTAEWCAKSGLDTTEDNVSCDSAATDRVMINAYRWAQGAEPYGDAIHAYRQMLINHEVGHRIGFNHVTCDKDGELAPVMQQQTKFVDHDGIDCRPNAWAFPND